jgi:uncharacterized NAD(P)/FAD-binding protein YdhS
VAIFSRPRGGAAPPEPGYPGPGAGRGPVIAIIGGGASGTLAAVHLLHAAVARQVPLRIALIDRLGRHGLGQAYATTNPDHLLNAPAGRMSALAGDPDHLVRWAAEAGYPGPGFLPRPVYGRYLRDLLADARQRAQPASALAELTADVVAIRPGSGGRPVRLVLGDGSCLEADAAILASGNPPPVVPIPVPASPRFVADPWAPGALDAVTGGSPVVIMGTGLTALDVAMSVTSGDGGRSPARVTVVSRHGLLPKVHRGMPAPGGESVWLPALAGPPGPVRLGDLIWQVRAAMTSRPEQWQDVVDALRPEVPSLWPRLSPADQRVFLRHVARYWEIHRHRMPPATAQRITALRIAGRLRVLPARVTAVTEQAGQLQVSVTAGGAVSQLAAGWLINATGPGTDITATTDPLLRDLLDRGLARPDRHRLGIDASTDGAVLDSAGTPSATLFTLGPPLRGLRYETTAVPEIRDQAAALAGQLTTTLAARYRPGSAA